MVVRKRSLPGTTNRATIPTEASSLDRGRQASGLCYGSHESSPCRRVRIPEKLPTAALSGGHRSPELIPPATVLSVNHYTPDYAFCQHEKHDMLTIRTTRGIISSSAAEIGEKEEPGAQGSEDVGRDRIHHGGAERREVWEKRMGAGGTFLGRTWLNTKVEGTQGGSEGRIGRFWCFTRAHGTLGS
jgi:hypothetical protein